MTDERILSEDQLKDAVRSATGTDIVEFSEYGLKYARAIEAAARADERAKGEQQLAEAERAIQEMKKIARQREPFIAHLQQQLAEARKDAERFDWLVGKVSGAEYRRLGIVYDDRYSLESAIDADRESSK